jgi:NTE family protein
MKLGLCLVGGGAKGAFQGGAIKRFHENGISFNVLTGTSIGAINSYFIMKGAFDELEKYWLNMDMGKYQGKIDMTIDNSKVIELLEGLDGNNDDIKNVYVNYVKVENSKLSQVVVDIKNVDKKRALDAVRYSSLLPARVEEGTNSEDLVRVFDTQNIFRYFEQDLAKGLYDGYNLDGGILNNNFLEPFIDNKVDKIVVIGLKSDYTPPEYIYNYYDKSNIIVIKPDVSGNPGDTIRFERDYCVDMFNRGYKLSEEAVNAFKIK